MRYQISDDGGNTLVVEADKAPSQADAAEIFSKQPNSSLPSDLPKPDAVKDAYANYEAKYGKPEAGGGTAFGPVTSDLTQALGEAIVPHITGHPDASAQEIASDILLSPVRAQAIPFAFVPHQAVDAAEKVGADIANIPFIGLKGGGEGPFQPGKSMLPQFSEESVNEHDPLAFKRTYNQLAEMITPGNVAIGAAIHGAGEALAPTLAPRTAEALKETTKGEPNASTITSANGVAGNPPPGDIEALAKGIAAPNEKSSQAQGEEEITDSSGAKFVPRTNKSGGQSRQWTQTSTGLRVGSQYNEGMPEAIVASESGHTPGMPSEYVVKEVNGVLSPTEIELKTRDMTPDEIAAKQEKLKAENAMRRDLGIPEEPIPEPIKSDVHGGGEGSLSETQRKESRQNNSREAFLKLQAEADAKKGGVSNETQTQGQEGPITTVPESPKVAEADTSAPANTEVPASQLNELVGVGGALHGEVAGKGNPDIYGVAQRVREERAAAGQVEPVSTGEGISAPDSVVRGRELISSGANPEKVLSDFESTNRLSSDDMAVVRAHGEDLAKIARDTESKFGTDSPEYKAAKDNLSEWDKRTKPMQTEWHKTGQAQQGATDIDTGSFTGLEREHRNNTGEDFTPTQAETAKGKAKKVSIADAETQSAKTKLAEQLGEQSKGAESKPNVSEEDAQKIKDAESALTDAEKKTHQAKTPEDKKLSKEQEDAARRDLDAANKTVRENAIRLAKEASKQRAKESAAKRDAASVQEKANQKALDAAKETARKAAIKLAEAENKKRVADTLTKKAIATIQEKAAQRALDAANKAVTDAAAKAAKEARTNRANPEIPVWKKVQEYLDKGEDSFDEIRNKVATDLGMPVKKVTDILTSNRRAKYLADDLWKKQQRLRRFQNDAKRWLTQTQLPWYQKALAAIPRALFATKVGFHGTVALGTHAPMVAFQPHFWKTYIQNFGRMYRMVGSPAYYEMKVNDLTRSPNYTVARRAGLVNDPHQYEDFNNPEMSQALGRFTGMGNRGYSVLKMLRQDMFDQMWNNLPKTSKIPEVAEAIADGLNHATGVVKASAPQGANIALFAPRLLASRAAWLVADPIKAVDTFANWKNADPGDKAFAINQVKEKATVMATLFSMLAINQGILAASGSKQKINFDNPLESDFLKFKVAGKNVSYGNAMLTMARLPARLYQITSSDGGKLKHVVFPDESTYSALGEYARSQMSPAAALATDLWFKSDWQNRPLPNSNRPMPKRLAQQGTKPYTWPEFATQTVLPIPAEEAMKEVWKNGFGASPDLISKMEKAMVSIAKAAPEAAAMAATGSRISEDYKVKPSPFH